MVIKDFCDMEQFEDLMQNWAKATGLATVAVGADGEYISKCYNFTEFCIDLTRGSAEGKRRCENCDRTGKGVYPCHAGLIDFATDIMIGDEKMGSIIGGQVLPEEPDEENVRRVAKEIGVDEEAYLYALSKVNIRTREQIEASAALLGQVINYFVNSEYETKINRKNNKELTTKLTDGVIECESRIKSIQHSAQQLNEIEHRQNMLAINARIEAARAGEAGKGFSVVAGKVGELAKDIKTLNSSIAKTVTEISDIVHGMAEIEGKRIQELEDERGI